MSIKMSQEVPEITDVSNPDSMRQWMIAVKQCIEELARKMVSSQEEIRTSAPGVNDLSEGEQVRAVVGGLTYIYTKVNGQILRYQVT